MVLRWLLVFTCLAPLARAESLPSFHLPFAARHASQVLVVQDGQVVESWKGGMPEERRFPSGPPSPQPVVYGFDRLDQELVLADLKKRGLTKVEAVTGKRMVHFLVPEKSKVFDQRQLIKDRAYCTIWIESDQAFAIVQRINPGPSAMCPLDLTEAELKRAVIEISTVYQDLTTVLQEPDRRKRAEMLVSLLKPDARWRNDELFQALRDCGREAWPVLEPLLVDERYLPWHNTFISIAYYAARRDAKTVMERILGEERQYFNKLTAAGQAIDETRPPHSYHRQRQSAAQWALDSMRY